MESSEIPVTETTVTPAQQEKEVPENNLIRNYNKLFYFLRLVTRKSIIEGSKIEGTDSSIERPISQRATRAQLFKKFLAIPKSDKEGRKNILAEAHVRDEITKQYLNQGEVKVNIPRLGEQSARYTVMEPPQPKIDEAAKKPPIFLIPGLANDIDCVGALAQELPFMGRKTIVVGVPESEMGRITPEFTQAASNTDSFSPHCEFFKGAVNALVGENQLVELWGYSSGSTIIAEMLNDPEFRQKVSCAVLLSPAASSNITKNALNLGILNELRNLLSRNLPKYTLSLAKSSGGEQDRLKGEVFQAMLKKVRTATAAWKKARVRDGGKIVIFSGEKDFMTKSFEIFKGDPASTAKLKQENPQIEVIDSPNAFHTTPLLEPQTVIQEVSKVQGWAIQDSNL